MAATQILKDISLAIEVQNGKDAKGNPTYTKKSFANVRTEVDAQNVYDVADAIKAVLSQPTRAYMLNKTSELANQA